MSDFEVRIIPFEAFEQNCALFFDAEARDGVVVDPGGNIDGILTAIAENGVNVKAIWLTHGHLDHVGVATELKERLGVPIIGPHADDLWLLQSVETDAETYGLPAGAMRNVTPDKLLNEGDEASFGSHVFDVYHAPGHTPGHVIFFNRQQKFAHLGDVMFKGAIGPTHFPGGNHEQLLETIRTKVLPLGEDVSFICGHGPDSSIGEERQTNAVVRDL